MEENMKDSKVLRFVMGEGGQRRKEAVEETRKMARDIRLSNCARSIDETIGFLKKHNIEVSYKAF